MKDKARTRIAIPAVRLPLTFGTALAWQGAGAMGGPGGRGFPGLTLAGIIALSLAAAAAPALAQQQAFSNPEAGPIEYWRTPFAAESACSGLLALSGPDFTLLTAVEQTIDGVAVEFCKVDGIIPPEIRFQVDMPLAWNGRLYMHGNGGAGGRPADDPLRWGFTVNALRHGFAVVYSNAGHDAVEEPGLSFAYRNPVKKLDWAFRATQLSAAAAKEILAAFYRRQSDYEYFDGCSWGGHQGFAMAQRFPDLFDGIVVGAPVFNYTGVHFNHRQVYGAFHPDWPRQHETDALAEAILTKCDALDGLTDGVVQNPRMCEFDPVADVPSCDSGHDAGQCMASERREAFASIYRPVVAATGETLAPGRPVSAEIKGYAPVTVAGGQFAIKDGWAGTLTAAAGEEPFLLSRLAGAVTVFLFAPDDLERSWLDFDIDRDWQSVLAQAAYLNETNPDLRPFREAGGKMIVYHGWADYNINPNLTYEYFQAVHEVMGRPAADDTTRLFMAPGMYHCWGGHDVFEFDGMTPLINWVEGGDAPERIVFSGNENFNPGRERPVCAFPNAARFRGGDPDRPESFECAE